MKKLLIILIALTLLAPSLQAEVTYSEHIAPILQKQCQSCHRQGEVAPFALTDYRDAKAWATEIAEYTKARLMPPWKPAGRTR